MAAKTLEARFEHLTVHDENEAPAATSTMLKSKVVVTAFAHGNTNYWQQYSKALFQPISLRIKLDRTWSNMRCRRQMSRDKMPCQWLLQLQPPPLRRYLPCHRRLFEDPFRLLDPQTKAQHLLKDRQILLPSSISRKHQRISTLVCSRLASH